MDTQNALAQCLAKADACLAEAQDLERQAERLRVRHEAYLDAAELFRPLLVEDEDDLTGLVVDFTGCNSIVDRLVSIGLATPHKLLNTTKAAQCLLENGQSKSDLKNYRTEVNRALSNNSQLFAKVSAGTYRYVGDVEAVSEVVHGPVDAPAVSGILECPNVGHYGPVEG